MREETEGCRSGTRCCVSHTCIYQRQTRNAEHAKLLRKLWCIFWQTVPNMHQMLIYKKCQILLRESIDYCEQIQDLLGFPMFMAKIITNGPDIVVLDIKEKQISIIGVAWCLNEMNLTEEEMEKTLKYKEFQFELHLTYPKLKLVFIPLVCWCHRWNRFKLYIILQHLKEISIVKDI